jgi:hypothetical protein
MNASGCWLRLVARGIAAFNGLNQTFPFANLAAGDAYHTSVDHNHNEALESSGMPQMPCDSVPFICG